MEPSSEDDVELVPFEKILDYRIIELIDYGSFGDIYKVKHSVDNKIMAVKQLTFRGKFRDDPYIVNEIYCLTHLKHRNIIQMHNIIFEQNEINIVMEYAVNENLERYMEKHMDIEFCMKYKIFSQVLQGVEYCHSMDIAHRDLNPSNVLLTSDMVVKIADFGLAVKCFSDEGDPVLCEDYLGRVCYLAPEILQKKAFLLKPADIWSLGIILIFILFHSTPFTGFDEDILEAQIKENWKDFIAHKCKSVKQNLKDNILTMIARLLELDPVHREIICGLVRTWDEISPDTCFVL